MDEPATILRARLTVKRGGVLTEDIFEFAPPATIGRFDPGVGPVDVDLANLPEASYVSRKHAQIVCEDGAWKLRDLGSANGSYLLREEFERVEEAELSTGQEIALGNARFIFEVASDQATAAENSPEEPAQEEPAQE